MVKSKYDFIKEMLVDKSINQNQRERIFNLASKELERSTIEDEKVIKDIKLIKEKLGLLDVKHPNREETIKEEDTLKTEEDDYKWAPTYICSKNTYKYFFNFNKSEILKSTCHPIDSSALKTINNYCNTNEYNFEKHLLKIKEAFEANDKTFAPGFVKNFVRLYILGKYHNGIEISRYNKYGNIKGWSDDKLNFSWDDNNLKKWSEKNKTIPPNPSEGLARKYRNKGYEFQDILNNSYGNRINNFTNFTRHFKKLFHIKSGSALKSLLNFQNDKNNWTKKVSFSPNKYFTENVELFTYVERLLQAYNTIISLIIEIWEDEKKHKPSLKKPEINLIFEEDENVVYFKIQHLNSTYKKSIFGIKNRLHGQTYRNLINQQINGLCDFFVEADFGNKKYKRINIWDENYKKNKRVYKNPINIEEIGRDIDGVTHILEFKKF